MKCLSTKNSRLWLGIFILQLLIFSLTVFGQESVQIPELSLDKKIERQFNTDSVHVYKVFLIKGEIFRADVQERNSNIALLLLEPHRLENIFGQVDDSPGSGREVLLYSATESKIYWFVVASKQPKSNGGYVLESRITDKLLSEWDSSVLPNGLTIERRINGEQYHTYSAILKTGQTIKVQIKEKGADLHTALAIFSESKEPLIVSDLSSGNGIERLVFTAKKDAEYNVFIANKSQTASGSYELSADVSPAKNSEINEQPLPINKTLHRSLTGKESHIYPIRLKAGQVLQVESQEKGIRHAIRLFDISAEKIVFTVGYKSESRKNTLTFLVEKTGSYFVFVITEDKATEKDKGDYSISAKISGK